MYELPPARYSDRDLSYPRSDPWLVDDLLVRVNRPWRISGPSRKKYAMNKYGRFAMDQWRQLAPTALSEIPDPNRHFSMLGEQAQDQIVDLSLELEGDDVPGETYWEKVGRLENAKLRAEEMVRHDLLIPPVEMQDVSEEELQGDLPSQDETSREIAELREDLQRALDDQPPPAESTPPPPR